jgi:hypothetical protein
VGRSHPHAEPGTAEPELKVKTQAACTCMQSGLRSWALALAFGRKRQSTAAAQAKEQRRGGRRGVLLIACAARAKGRDNYRDMRRLFDGCGENI